MQIWKRLGPRARYYAAGVLAGSTGKGLTWVLALAELMLLTRVLGSAQFGTYAFVLAITTFLVPLASGGLNHLVLYRVSETDGHDDGLAGGGLVTWCLYRVAGISVLLALAVAVGVHASGLTFGHAPFAFWMTVAAASLPFQAVNQVFGFWYRANRRVTAASLMPLVREIIYVAALIGIWMAPVGHLPLDPAHLVATGFLGAAILATLFWIAHTPRACFAPGNPPAIADHGYALRTMATRVVQQGVERIDVVMVGILLSSTVTANYAVAARLARLALMGNRILAPVLTPRLRHALAAGEHSTMAREYDATRRVSLGAALLASAVMLAFGDRLLALFGPFVTAWPVLVILCGAYIVQTGFGPNGRYLKMAGASRMLLGFTVLIALANVGLNLLLVPVYGMLGASVATAVAVLTVNSLMCAAIWHQQGFVTLGPGTGLSLAVTLAVLGLAAVGVIGAILAASVVAAIGLGMLISLIIPQLRTHLTAAGAPSKLR